MLYPDVIPNVEADDALARGPFVFLDNKPQGLAERDADKVMIRAASYDEVMALSPVTPENCYLEMNAGVFAVLMAKEATKLLAATALTQRLGYSLSDCVFFGDDYNDVGLLLACGVGVAMENAIDEAKKAADYVTLSNAQDGVAAWLWEHALK